MSLAILLGQIKNTLTFISEGKVEGKNCKEDKGWTETKNNNNNVDCTSMQTFKD